MKFSNDTMGILKNFSKINPSILFKPGQKLRTISPSKTIMAEAIVEETFTQTAGVYDISQFIGTLTLFEDPDIVFGDEMFTIRGGNSELKYTYTAENMIVIPPDGDIKIPSVEAVVKVTSDVLEDAIKAANLLGLTEITFVAENGTISVAATDSRNPTSNQFKTEIATGMDCSDFRMGIKKDNVRLLPADYDVTLSKSGMAHFKSEKVQYWIAVESA
jgi:hypothetical protein